MASILQILRRIGGAKAAPATGKAGELALWKAGAAATDAVSLYMHDGVQWLEVLDSNTLMIDAANNRVGFSTATPASQADVNGTASHNVITTTGVMNLALGQMFVSTSKANTFWFFSNVPIGRGVTVVLHLTDGGAHTQNWAGIPIKWPGGHAPILTSGGTDVLVFVTHDGGATWRGNIFGKDIK